MGQWHQTGVVEGMPFNTSQATTVAYSSHRHITPLTIHDCKS